MKSASVRKTGIQEWSLQACHSMLTVLNSIFTHVLVCMVSSLTFRNQLFSYTILAYLCTNNCASLLAMIWAFAADSFRVGSRPWTWDYWESWCENSLQTSHLLFSFSFPVSVTNTNHTNTLSRNWWQWTNKMSIEQKGNERRNNKGPYNIIRVLIHVVGFLQFSYSVYYDWNYVVIPLSASTMGSGYGGKLKFLTNWDAVSLQWIMQDLYKEYSNVTNASVLFSHATLFITYDVYYVVCSIIIKI